MLLVQCMALWAIGQPIKHQLVSGEALVKLKETHRNFFAQRSIKGITITEIKQVFGERVVADREENQVDLSLIYSVKSEDIGFIEDLKSLQVFEYVEPRYVYQTTHNPNDVELNNQPYLQQIKAFSAWDQTKGNTIVTIGVVDTGTDLEHPDLVDKIQYNTNDPINGVDDDADGYIDNFQGWDFVDNNHIPQIDESNHGAHVAGTAAAATNNGIGVASVGYNCRYLPIRVGNGRAITHGYEGIVYAADMGCDIINCSWGGSAFSQYGQDIINYATYNKGALVVAAAGNNGKQMNFYPAAYQNVLAVGSVNSNNVKSSFSNWGYWVDVMAPGENVLSTVQNGEYARNTGTSMACPMVSGLAGLVKSKYPHLSPLQITARIKNSATNIDATNSATVNQNGAGLIHSFNAVNGLITNVHVEFGSHWFTNATDDIFKHGDEVKLYGVFTNALAEASNVTATLSSTSSSVNITAATINLGDMPTAIQIDNYQQPFKFTVMPSAVSNEKVLFTLTIDSDQSIQEQFYELEVGQDFRNVEINNVGLTVGSKGQLGYNTKAQVYGIGMRYLNGASQLFEAGLMIAVQDSGIKKVVDNVRSNQDSYDDDFAVVTSINEVNHGQQSRYEVLGVFNDDSAGFDKIGLAVTYRVYAEMEVSKANYVIAEYQVVNNTASDLQNLAIGLFSDFDVTDYSKNRSRSDMQRYLMFTESTVDGAPLFGVQLLTSQSFNCYGIDNVDGGLGGVDMYNRFISADKYEVLTQIRTGAGLTGSGNDVVQVVGAKNIDIAANDTAIVAFALLAAPDVEGMRNAADSAYHNYNGIFPNSVTDALDKAEWVLFPNPAKQQIVIHSATGEVINRVRIYNTLGQIVHQQQGVDFLSELVMDLKGLKSGVYFVEVDWVNSGRQIKTLKKL